MTKTCTLDACRTCTGCAHGHHDKCRREVRCPDDLQWRRCRCCGFDQHPNGVAS